MSVKRFGSPENVENWTQKIHAIMEEMSNRIFFEYRASQAWQPRVNLYNTDAALLVCVELAGLLKDSLLVQCADARHVRISGQRARASIEGLQAPYGIEMLEIDEGPFCRDIGLPDDVEPKAIEIAYDRGYLWIILPKTNRR